MKITLLGTGTSTGVPQIGCSCELCTSTDPRDNRLRTSALIETVSTRILIDCGPDFRAQMLRARNCASFDAILLTHLHSDHIGGLDDLRPDKLFGEVDIYTDQRTALSVRERMPYCFREQKYPGIPLLRLHQVGPATPFKIGDIEIQPFEVLHGTLPILGFRLNEIAFITDMKSLPEQSYSYLKEIKLLVVNGLRNTPHDTHQTIQEACAFAQRIGAPATYLVHFNHQAPLHAQMLKTLPDRIYPGYDQQVIEI